MPVARIGAPSAAHLPSLGASRFHRWCWALATRFQRAIADVVSVTITINDPQKVVFQCTNGNLTVSQGGADVTAYLVNIPIASLLGSTGGKRSPEMHFRHFCRLLVNTQSNYFPTPVSDCLHAFLSPQGRLMSWGRTELVPHCPPAVF